MTKLQANFPFAVTSSKKIGQGHSSGDLFVTEVAVSGTFCLLNRKFWLELQLQISFIG